MAKKEKSFNEWTNMTPPPKFTNTCHCLIKDLKRRKKKVILVGKIRFSYRKLLDGSNELRKISFQLCKCKPTSPPTRVERSCSRFMCHSRFTLMRLYVEAIRAAHGRIVGRLI